MGWFSWLQANKHRSKSRWFVNKWAAIDTIWQSVALETRFCIICVAVPYTRALEVSVLMCRLFALAPLHSEKRVSTRLLAL